MTWGEKTWVLKKENNLPGSSQRAHAAGIKDGEFLHGEKYGGRKRGWQMLPVGRWESRPSQAPLTFPRLDRSLKVSDETARGHHCAAVDHRSRDDGWVDVDAQYVTSYRLSVFFDSHLCSSTVCTAGIDSSTSHEHTNSLIDFPCTRSHTLPTQPICDSLYYWQKISPRSKGPSNCTASQ